MQIREMGLSKWATNCLYRAGITTVEELRQKRTWELQSIPSFGAKCLREVQEALERLEAEKPMTHADCIRAMSDYELAEFLLNFFVEHMDLNGIPHEEVTAADMKEILRQLKLPAEEG